MSIETHESRTAGMESAHFMTLTVRFDNGAGLVHHGHMAQMQAFQQGAAP